MKEQKFTRQARPVGEAVEFLKKLSEQVPSAAVVLGSGVHVLEDLKDSCSIPYSEVFGVAPTIEGHTGSLSIGRIESNGPMIAVLRGRFHLYEGHDWTVVTLPTRVISAWGVPKLFLTNAAGGLNRSFTVGDLMVVTGYRDHLNPCLKESGQLPALKEPATDCQNALTKELLVFGERLAAAKNGFRPLQKGVYAAVLGPNYETMAEIEMLRRLNADAVGMSTVPELKTACLSDTMSAAISVITNVWREDVPIRGHEEVLAECNAASQRLDLLLRTVLAQPMHVGEVRP
jgi:purine-nucleoside phosphorylase